MSDGIKTRNRTPQDAHPIPWVDSALICNFDDHTRPNGDKPQKNMKSPHV